MGTLMLLARKYQLIASCCSSLEDEGLMDVFASGAHVLKDQPDAKTRLVYERLWQRLGGQLRVIMGSDNSDFQDLCKIFGTPEGHPSIELIIQELTAVQACTVCGVAAVYGCQRCKKTVYCCAACQRAHWPIHRETCRSAVN